MPIQSSINQAIGSISQLTALSKMSKEQEQKNKVKEEKEKAKAERQAKRDAKELSAYHLMSVQEEQLKRIEKLQKSIKTQKERVAQFKNLLKPFMTEEELAMRGNKGVASTLNRLSKGAMQNGDTKTQRT